MTCNCNIKETGGSVRDPRHSHQMIYDCYLEIVVKRRDLNILMEMMDDMQFCSLNQYRGFIHHLYGYSFEKGRTNQD
jgi:hypothetical protein